MILQEGIPARGKRAICLIRPPYTNAPGWVGLRGPATRLQMTERQLKHSRQAVMAD